MFTITGISYRRAVQDEAGLVQAISADAYIPAYEHVIGAVPGPAFEDYKDRISAGEVWIADVDNAPSGLLVLDRQTEYLLVYSIAVLPHRQKQGLGRALLLWAEHRAEQMRLPEIRLYTNRRMERNLKLYRQCGFVEAGERPHPSREGEVLVDMVKSIRDPVCITPA